VEHLSNHLRENCFSIKCSSTDNDPVTKVLRLQGFLDGAVDKDMKFFAAVAIVVVTSFFQAWHKLS
jgi:hypothetical protein